MPALKHLYYQHRIESPMIPARIFSGRTTKDSVDPAGHG